MLTGQHQRWDGSSNAKLLGGPTRAPDFTQGSPPSASSTENPGPRFSIYCHQGGRGGGAASDGDAGNVQVAGGELQAADAYAENQAAGSRRLPGTAARRAAAAKVLYKLETERADRRRGGGSDRAGAGEPRASLHKKQAQLGMMTIVLSVTPADGGQLFTAASMDGEEKVKVVRFMQGRYAGPALYKLASKAPIGGMAVVKGKLLQLDSGPVGWELKGTVEITTPEEWEQNTSKEAGGKLQPVYTPARPLTGKDMAKIMPRAIKAIEASRCSEDPLPEDVVQRTGLMPWMDALQTIHMPGDLDTLEEARRRLAFQELFMVQLSLFLRRYTDVIDPQVTLPEEGLQAVDTARAFLPFQLTGDQQKAVSEILDDLCSGKPMLRLLQGDVGSGKTAVAFLAMLAAAKCGWQVALMAPTEVLAAQHKRNMDDLIARLQGAGAEVPKVAMLTGSTRAAPRRQTLEGLADGSLQIVIGTHALISGGVEFKRLGLAVVDEQHRFGVEQRSVLHRAGGQQSANLPVHLLYLSATPIPRTLALVAYGEVDISVIRERPPGRTAVRTQVMEGDDASREVAYRIIRRELAEGFRSYVICPLVETSEAEGFEELKAAEDEYKRLQESGCLGGANCGLLHGRMTGEEKGAALRSFADGHTQVLIATSVVEVGVDVPEATVMVIEHAERFGLAQLHQLRGRIGRGTRASECVMLVGGSSSGKAMQRLKVLENSEDGFEIAEVDLRQRGPGDFMGTRQSGERGAIATTLQAARLPQDAELLEAAREEVKALVEPDGPGSSGGSLPMRLWGAYRAYNLPELDIRSGSSILLNIPQHEALTLLMSGRAEIPRSAAEDHHHHWEGGVGEAVHW
eukprot:CAMPEP_0117673240 /NCGR_PEP_ID=MMETSP0804-20121206/14362_1 /TAXON_ID=1074897 /ORGANISM="Tetraselmis astigmatica, Strain CCMP880" /LENGTH=854 /DNA_ID=CAMNT_0005481955 /DNA_START=183 /DNA_END=2746 /DNA_ORIENTATION=+